MLRRHLLATVNARQGFYLSIRKLSRGRMFRLGSTEIIAGKSVTERYMDAGKTSFDSEI